MQKLIIYGTVLCALYSVFFHGSGSVSLGPGVKAPQTPVQTGPRSSAVISLKGFQIIPLAEYSLTAKILSRKSYSSGREADLSPLDFALGWGNMSDEALVKQLSISQSGRWYSWSTTSEPSVPVREIEQSSANVHLIPANDTVEMMLKQMKQGEIVSLRGKLVRVEAPEGWKWESSLTRNDTGANACEVMYVEGAFKKSAL